MAPTHRIRLLCVSITLLVCGCLDTERYEIRSVHDPVQKTWTTTHTFWGLGSNEEDTDERAKDFEALMEAWKGDELAADTTNGQVVERSVWVEGDQVHGRMVSVAGHLPTEFELSADSMAVDFELTDPDDLIETNGTLKDGESPVLRWPAGVKEIRVRLKGTGSLHPFSKEQRERIEKEGGAKK